MLHAGTPQLRLRITTRFEATTAYLFLSHSLRLTGVHPILGACTSVHNNKEYAHTVLHACVSCQLISRCSVVVWSWSYT